MKEERKEKRRKKLAEVLVYERFEIIALLCIAGGFMDAYTYLVRDKVFANAQTGNIILLVFGLCEGRFFDALKYLVPIALFAAGVVVSEFIISRERKNGAKLANYVALLVIEAVVLAGAAFIPVNEEWNLFANALVSFVASVQYAAFRKIENIPAATSFCTGNLRSATQYLYRGVAAKDKAAAFTSLKFWAMIAFFALGVAAGFFAVQALGALSLLCCSLYLLLLGGLLAALKAFKMKKLREFSAEEEKNGQNPS